MNQQSQAERLVDYLLVVGPGRGIVFEKSFENGSKSAFTSSLGVLTDSWHKVASPKPTILRRFPGKDHPDFELAFDIAYFCQPEGSCEVLTEPRSHVFMLTDTETNIHTYGVCLSLPHLFDPLMKAQSPERETCNVQEEETDSLCIQEWGALSVCLLSRHPFFSFFESCLKTLHHFVSNFCGDKLTWNALIRSQFQTQTQTQTRTQPQQIQTELHGNAGHIHKAVLETENWINNLLALRAPVPGEIALEVELEVNPALVVSYPPSNRLPLLELPVHKVFKKLGVCNVIDIYKLVLSEQKVILFSTDAAFVSECVLTIMALLYPLQYLFPVIPLLPSSMPTAENLLMVPTPFLIGVSHSFLSKLEEVHHSETWLVNLDSGEFQPPDQLDVPLLEFPFCILQLQADIRRALDKLDHPDLPDPRVFESSLAGHLSEEERGHCLRGEVDVSIRTAFVEFLFSPEILGSIDHHLCVFRLFPRPVVSLRLAAFLANYQKSAPSVDMQFIRDLIRSQGIEYFFEWSLNPDNSAFEEIRKGIREVDHLSDKQPYYVHNSSGAIVQTCLYHLSDDSILYQEMLGYKASQASYHLVSGQEVTTDDSSDWDYLVGDYYDGGSEFSASTPSYYSDDRRSVSPLPQQRYVLTSRSDADPTDAVIPIAGHLDMEPPEVNFHHPARFNFPLVDHPNSSEATPVHVRNESMVTAVDPDESSLTESAFYNRPRHLLHVSQQAPNRMAVSCEALPVTDDVSPHRDKSATEEETDYHTPHAIDGVDGRPAKHPFARRRRSKSSSPEELHFDEEEPVLVTRRMISGSPQPPQQWLNLTPLSEVVGLGASSSLRRSNSLRLKGERGDTPPFSRTVPISAVTHSQALEHQLLDVVMKILDGQGISWPKPPGLKRLASQEKTRVMVLRLLEVKLGLRKPDSFSTATQPQIQPVGVAKSVFRGLVDLLKYLLQCVEEELQKEPEASIFSVFLILRVAFSVYLHPKKQPHTVKITKQELRHPTILPFPVSVAQETGASSQNQEETTGASSRESTPQKQPSPRVVKAATPLSSSSSSPRQTPEDVPPTHTSSDANPHTRRALKLADGEEERRSDDVLTTPVPLSSPENITTPIVDGAVLSSEEPSGSVTSGSAANKSPPLTPASRDSQQIAPVGNGTHKREDTVLDSPKASESNMAASKDSPQSQQFYTPSPDFPDARKRGSEAPPLPLYRRLERMKSGPLWSRSPRLLEMVDPKNTTFLYKDLMKALGSGRTFMLSRQFWNLLFMSTIDIDRNYLGWNESTAELYQRYASLSEAHRQAFALEEDTLFSLVLHNLLVYMLMVGLSPQETTDLIHRITAKIRLAIIEEKLLQQTLKHVEQSTTADLDLSTLGLLALYSEVHPTVSYIVHYGVNMTAPVYKLQITSEALILRRFPDEKISGRLWNDCISELSCNERRATVSIKYCDNHGEYTHHFHSKQFMRVYESLQILAFGGSS